MPKSPASLSGIDLNLLVVFDALMAERHVARAAKRVGLSQPGLSHALARLRVMTGDPLFERRRDGMQPTAHALALAEPIGASLHRLRRALIGEPAFDPTTVRRRFSLTISDGGAAALLPMLIPYLRQQAPGVDLRLIPSGLTEGLEHVLSGEADVGVGVYPNLPSGLHSQVMNATRFVCVADARHSDLANGLDRSTFLALPHVAVAAGAERGANIDLLLEVLGLERRVMLSVPHFLLAMRSVIGSDLLAVLPEALVRAAPQEGVRTHPLPVEIGSVSMRMVWRERNDGDFAQQWFRSAIGGHFV